MGRTEKRRARHQQADGQRSVRVVALNGSPHRDGNTATLIGWVLEGCVEAGADVSWLHVVDYEIGYCQGCFACLRQGTCPIDDDLAVVRQRLVAADGIVVGSPVYEDQPTAQLKTLMDRLALLVLYTDTFAGHRSVGVATSGLAPTRNTAKAAELFGRCSGAIGARVTSLSEGHRSLSEAHGPLLRKRAQKLGRRLVRDIRRSNQGFSFDLKVAWMRLLRGLLRRLVVERHPEQFSGVLDIVERQDRDMRLT